MDYSSLIARKDADFNEEQTKHALVLPVLDRILGWDIYDSLRLIPEYTADTPGKNGEKVDYALDFEGDGIPEVLIEAKPLGSRLNSKAASQLYRYFTMTESVIGILTDGYRWMIYSDLNKPNVMDDEPFLDFTIEDLASKKSLEKLFLSLSFGAFDAIYLRSWGELSRDTERLRELVKKELTDPSEDFTKHFFSRLHPGARATAGKIDPFRTRLMDVLAERNSEEAAVQRIELKEPVAVPKRTRTVVRRTGYFRSSFGHRSTPGSMRATWVEYWTDVAKDEELREKLIEVALNNKPKGLITIEPGPSVSQICEDLYIRSTLDHAYMMGLLGQLSELLGIESEVVYTDGLDDELSVASGEELGAES